MEKRSPPRQNAFFSHEKLGVIRNITALKTMTYLDRANLSWMLQLRIIDRGLLDDNSLSGRPYVAAAVFC